LGYKAQVKLRIQNGRIAFILTGFSYNGAKKLFDSLKAMKKEEVFNK